MLEQWRGWTGLRMSILEGKRRQNGSETERGKIEIVEVYAEEECWVYREKDAEDEAARQEEKRKGKEVYGCTEGKHVGGCCNKGRCIRQDEVETGDLL